MLHPLCFLPILYSDSTDMTIFGMVIVLAFQIGVLLMGFTASFSSGPQLYQSWHEFPKDLLYKDVSSLGTKWRYGQKPEDPPCPNSYRDSNRRAGGGGLSPLNILSGGAGVSFSPPKILYPYKS